MEQFISTDLPSRQFSKALTAGRGALCDHISTDREPRLFERAADAVALANQFVSIDQTIGYRIHEAGDSEGAANVVAIVCAAQARQSRVGILLQDFDAITAKTGLNLFAVH
jgi:hypothetical protein